MQVVLSQLQAARARVAHAEGRTEIELSFDLGRSQKRCELDDSGVTTVGMESIPWSVLAEIEGSSSVCFLLEAGHAAPLRAYSEVFARTYQLYPTPQGPPALLLSGFVMHRLRDVDPFEGAERMVRALGTVRGRVLDTCTGLGYAAIGAARSAARVVTIELDETVRSLARKNPWSRELFESANVELVVGDSAQLIRNFEDASFSAIIHDPPAINVAGALYSGEFYRQARRVLGRSGKFFHYVGDPESASGGRTTQGVIKRLRDAGFTRISARPEAFGILAAV